MREQTLEQFYEKDAIPALDDALGHLEQEFQKTRLEQKKKFTDCFRGICTNTAQLRGESKTGFLIFHLMRTKILNHQYSYPVISYDKEWYANKEIMVGELDVSCYYKHYEDLWKRLSRESRKYIDQFCEPDIEQLMLKLLDPFHKYVVELMRYSLLDALETEEYMALRKEDHFEIQSGEYFEPGDLIHLEQESKDRFDVLTTIKQTNDQSCCFQDFKNLDLSNLISRQKDYRYTDFRNSDLQDIDFTNSLLIGTKFKNCSMKHANLMISMIHDACFDQADLTGSNLQYCTTFIGKNKANAWKNTGFTGTSFRHTCLAHTDFSGATIHGADFEGADLTGTVFEGATLYHSRFNKEQLNQCSFTSQQLEQIDLIP